MQIGKDLVAAAATPMVLGILAEGESYGYAILQRVSELSDGELEWSDGMLYPLLHRLERLGHVESAWHASPHGAAAQALPPERTRRGGLHRAATAVGCREPGAAAGVVRRGGGAPFAGAGVGGGADMRRPTGRGADRARGADSSRAARRSTARRRRARGPPARPDRRARGIRLSLRRGVPRRGEADGQPRRSLARVRPRALRPTVEAARHRRAAARRSDPTRAVLAIALAVGAALAVHLPRLFGLTFGTAPEVSSSATSRCSCCRSSPRSSSCAAGRARHDHRRRGAVRRSRPSSSTLYPFVPDGATQVLAAIHTAVALWIVTGIAYVDGDWRSDRRAWTSSDSPASGSSTSRCSDWAAACSSRSRSASSPPSASTSRGSSQEWMLPCGIAGAVVIAGWLVEAKQSVIENIAPVLTKGLHTAVHTAAARAHRRRVLQCRATGVESERDLLIIFDVVLIVVLALLLYSLSAREPLRPAVVVRPAAAADGRRRARDRRAPAHRDDRPDRDVRREREQARLARAQPHPAREPRRRRLAAVRVRARRRRSTRLERWQTAYVPVYLVWASIVVVVFPPLFSFA